MPTKQERQEHVTREHIRLQLSTGHTPRSIARELDLSTQRIYQYMEELRAQAALEDLESDSA